MTLPLVRKWRGNENLIIDKATFYNLTLGPLSFADKERQQSWPFVKTKDLWEAPPSSVAIGGKTRTPNDFNASVGAHQINGYLFNKGSDLAASIFGDDTFVRYMLKTYSNIKVYTDGSTETDNVAKPDIFDISSSKSIQKYIFTGQVAVYGTDGPESSGFFSEKNLLINMIILQEAELLLSC